MYEKTLQYVKIYNFFLKFFKIMPIYVLVIGHVMRKLNGITINGEYLGNSVVINGMFRAICTISPVIMRDFISIINKIDALEEAVKIHNFNCGFDSIDIEFENKNFKGIASLYFKLIEGQPVLTDCKLVIGDQVFSTIAQKDKITIKQPNTATNSISPSSVNDDLERKRRINEIKERKLEKLKQQAEQRKQRMNNVPPNPNMSKIAPNRENRDNRVNNPRHDIPKEQLTPEQLRKQKLQELLEKRKKAKQEAGVETGAGNTESSKYGSDKAANNSLQKTGDNLHDNQSVVPSSLQNDEHKSQQQKGLAPNARDSISDESGVQGQTSQHSDISNDNSVEKYGEVAQSADEQLSGDQKYDNEFSDENIANQYGNDSAYNSDDYSSYDDNGMYDEFGDNQFGSSQKPKLSIDDFTDEELENLSDEELAELEAQLEAEDSFDNGYDYSNNDSFNDYSYSSSDSYSGQGFNNDFAEKLSRGLTEGLTQGLSQGLSQGFQGLFQGLQSMGGGYGGYNNMPPPADDAGLYANQVAPMPAPQPIEDTIDDVSDEDTYYNMDEISDIYSNFYSSEDAGEEGSIEATNGEIVPDEGLSEIEMLKAELENLRSQAEEKKELMTLDEYKLKQQQLKDAMEQKRRQKFKIVGSKEHVNASALEGGVFVAGNKVYKWGETRYLDG